MKQIEITQGTNGYPKNTYGALVFDKIEDLKKYAKENEGEIRLLKKRDGWGFWEDKGTFHGETLLDIPVGDAEMAIDTDLESVEQDAKEHVIGDMNIPELLAGMMKDEDDIGEAIAILNSYKEKIDDIISEVRGKCRIYFDSANNVIDYVIHEDDVYFTEDVWTYRLAFVHENEGREFFVRNKKTGTEYQATEMDIKGWEDQENENGEFLHDFIMNAMEDDTFENENYIITCTDA